MDRTWTRYVHTIQKEISCVQPSVLKKKGDHIHVLNMRTEALRNARPFTSFEHQRALEICDNQL